MKKTYLLVGYLSCAVLGWAAPQTQVTVTHPTTKAPVQQPRTNTIVKQPSTLAVTTHPTTTVTVTHPTTIPTLQPTTAGGPKMSSGGSYASYKNAKTLAPSTTDIPKAGKLGKGESGLGKDANAANKDKQVSAAPKAESSQPSLEDVLKKTNIPSDIAAKLKQKNFEASKMSQRKS